MTPQTRRLLLITLALCAICGALLWIYWQPVSQWCLRWWALLQDKEAFGRTIDSYGAWGPVVFMGLQVLQVVASPIPGELVGAAGGFVFGWWKALLYSTIALSLGSWINFFLARKLGKPLVEKLVPPYYMDKLSFLLKRQGVMVCFVFFVFPGFPKDVLCYMLGISPMRRVMFMVISSVGRIPGTLMLSIQGYLVYQENYWSFVILLLLSLAFLAPVYFWREQLYRFLQRLDKVDGNGPEALD